MLGLFLNSGSARFQRAISGILPGILQYGIRFALRGGFSNPFRKDAERSTLEACAPHQEIS
ncbi:MAG: hypothetical protein HC767_13105 [Akkermansiaceae bacterium]|nr:hypothetical protein [Akkermansiaceae bacterium]